MIQTGQIGMRHASHSEPAHQPDGGDPGDTFDLGRASEDDSLPFMANPVDARRRWFGLFCLTISAGMLIWGQTVLKPLLGGLLFLAYWAVCFLFTFGAIVIALIDMRAVRKHIMDERKDLLRRTLEEIEQPRKQPGNSGEDASSTAGKE